MAVTSTLTLQEEVKLSSSSKTYNTGWVRIYTHGSYMLYGYASWTLSGYNNKGAYVTGPVTFSVKAAYDSSPINVAINSKSASSSGFSSSTFSTTTTRWTGAKTVYSSSTEAVVYGTSTASTLDVSKVAKSSTKTGAALCKCTLGINHVTGTSVTDIVSETLNIIINVNETGQGALCKLYYHKDDNTQYGAVVENYWFGTTTVKSGYTKSGYTDTDSGTYTVSFNSRGGSDIDDKEYAWSWRQPITYTFHDWGGYKPGDPYTFIDESKILKASFAVGSGDRVWTYRTLGTLPTATLKGYKRTNEWYYSNGNMATPSDQVTSSFTLKCQWEAQTYKIKFNLDGGKIPEEYGKISDYTVDKTYGSNNSVRMPPFTPTKLGYVFAGWSDQTGTCRKLQPNEYATDDAYNKENTDSTNKDVTLWAQWTLNPNIMKFNYFIMNNSGSYVKYTDTEYYNITQTTYSKHSPSHNNEMSGDYVFIGWCDLMPDNYGWADTADPSKQGYHGIYTLQTEAPESEDPVTVDISKLKNLEDWGVTQQYYGIWSKTGKYINVGNTFRKVNSAYVKIDGEWKVITDIWVRQNNSWHHEI